MLSQCSYENQVNEEFGIVNHNKQRQLANTIRLKVNRDMIKH